MEIVPIKQLIEDPIEVFLKNGLIQSRREGLRLIKQKGLHIGECTLTPNTKLFGSIFSGTETILLRRGKKQRCFIEVDFTDTWVVPV